MRSVIKVPQYEALRLVILEPLDEALEPCGEPLVAVDPLGAGDEQIVYWESSLEARMVAPDPRTAIDAGVVGLVDHLGSSCNSDA